MRREVAIAFIEDLAIDDEPEVRIQILGVYENEFKARRACEREARRLWKKFNYGDPMERWGFWTTPTSINKKFDREMMSIMRVATDYDISEAIYWETPQ